MSKEEKIIKNKYPGIIKPGFKIHYVIDSGRIIVNDNFETVDNCLDYIITKECELVLGLSHSYLANGEDVLAAGVIRLDSNGVVTEIKNESGHYNPTPNQTIVSIKLFEQFGIDLHGVTINNKTYT